MENVYTFTDLQERKFNFVEKIYTWAFDLEKFSEKDTHLWVSNHERFMDKVYTLMGVQPRKVYG